MAKAPTLREDPLLSYGDLSATGNRLIHGDNLLALRALESEFTRQIKCVYIDPPYNTQQSFELYDDSSDRQVWLAQMRERATLIHRLLTPDGTLFVHIDDHELGQLLVLLDEVFGAANRLYVVTFKQGSATGHKAINRGCVNTTNFVLIYAKDRSLWQPRRLFTARGRDRRYNQFVANLERPCDEWRLIPLTKGFAATKNLRDEAARSLLRERPGELDTFVAQHADRVVQLARPNHAAISEAARQCIARSLDAPDQVFKLDRAAHAPMHFKRGQKLLFYANKLKMIDGARVAGEPLTTLWDDLLSNNLHKEGGLPFPKGKKPEALLRRIIELSTAPGDWVLDAFAGSGTTGAVAHKMARRWLMIELGEHYQTHIIPRLRSVIDGSDTAGVSAVSGWLGGGGYRFYRIDP